MRLRRLYRMNLRDLASDCNDDVIIRMMVLNARDRTALRRVMSIRNGILLIDARANARACTRTLRNVLRLRVLRLDLNLNDDGLIRRELCKDGTLLVTTVGVRHRLVRIKGLLLSNSYLMNLLLRLVGSEISALITILDRLVRAAVATMNDEGQVILLPTANDGLVRVVDELYYLIGVTRSGSQLILDVDDRERNYRRRRQGSMLRFRFLIVCCYFGCRFFASSDSSRDVVRFSFSSSELFVDSMCSMADSVFMTFSNFVEETSVSTLQISDFSVFISRSFATFSTLQVFFYYSLYST